MKGSNQTKVRDYNERLVLHLIRQHGALTKADATRLTGLSPNAMSIIFGALEEEGLLLRGEPLRGRIGQPSVPLRLNPDARYHIGLKIGRRSFDMVLVDFCGTVRARRTRSHAFPTPARAVQFLQTEQGPLLRAAGVKPDRISGTGIAMPGELWHWTEEFGASRVALEAWRDLAPGAYFADLVPGPILVENDGTAACRAEWTFGKHPDRKDSIYFFIGTLVGGGIVLNGSVFTGCHGNSGGFGPLRIPDEPGGTRLVDHASLFVLEHMLAGAGIPFREVRWPTEDWSGFEPVLSDWLARAARSLAHAIVSSAAVIDFEHVIIDGSLPPSVRLRLVEQVDRCLGQLDLQGIVRPELRAGSFGGVARALGAASIHIASRYMIDTSHGLRS